MYARLAANEMRRQGVVHGDFRRPNILWSQEIQRVMLIDFERATLRGIFLEQKTTEQ